MSATAASSITSGSSTYKALTTSHPLVRTALARLSSEDRSVLAEFKTEFPNLIPEEMAKVANSFMLYRSLYVQKAREADPNGNQTNYSRDAAVNWRYIIAESEKGHYTKWHTRVRAVWKKMYPDGFPSSDITKTKKKRRQDAKTARRRTKKLTPRSSLYKKFQPLPSPPVSDDADFSAQVDSEKISHSMPEDDPRDNNEHFPERPSSQRNPCQSQPERCVELLTPASMVRELSPERSPRSSFPMPAFCGSNTSFSPVPAFGDIKLSELNGDCPSMFNDPLIFSPLPSHPQETRIFSEQTPNGYSPDFSLGTHSPFITRDETNFLSDSEIYLSLSSVPFSLYPDLLYADNFTISTDAVVNTLAQDFW